MHLRAAIAAGATVAALCAPASLAARQANAKPGRLVIIGGGLNANNEAVYRTILEARVGSGPFCVIPTAGATPDSAMASPVANFNRYGGPGTAKGVLISVARPETARDPAVVAQLRGCSGFFFVGGVQSRVTAAFRPQGTSTPAYEALMQRWRDGAVVSGSSAGAAIMSDPMIANGTSPIAFTRGVRRLADGATQDPDDTTSAFNVSQGLGLFPTALADQHFLARGRFGRLLVALLDLGTFNLAFGIDENTALVVDGQAVRTVGASGVTIFDARVARRNGRSATGIVMHLMGDGDAFDLTTRAFTPRQGKMPIVLATGDSATVVAPANIFAPWAFLRTLDGWSRSSQTELAFEVNGGQIVVHKSAAFRAVRAPGPGVQNTAAGLGMTGMTIDVRRP